MNYKGVSNEEIITKALNGCIACAFYILLENNASQIKGLVEKINPLFYSVNASRINELDNEQLSNYLTVQKLAGNMIFYIPKDSTFLSGADQTSRGKELKELLQKKNEF